MTYKTGSVSTFLEFVDVIDDFLCSTGHTFGLTRSGSGTGTMTQRVGGSASVAETITATATSSTTFSVVGSTTGAIGTATVGTAFSSSQVGFLISAGGVPFVAGDAFTLQTSPPWQRMRYAGCVGKDYRGSTNFTNATSIFDASLTTVCISTALPATAHIQLNKTSAVSSFAVVCGDLAAVTPASIGLEYSDDGSTWVPQQSYSGLTWAARERKTFSVSAPASHLWWRLTFPTAQSGQTAVRITEVEFYSAATNEWSLDDRFEAIWKAPGLDGTKSIYVGAYLYVDQASGLYNIAFNGFRYLDSTKAVTAQQNPSPIAVMLLNNQPFNYHMVANGQRVAIVGTPSGTWSSAYLGFGMPYETPGVHAFPMLVGACCANASYSISLATAEHRAFFSPHRNMHAYYPDNVWRTHVNRTQSASTSDGTNNSEDPKVYPWAYVANGTLLNYVRDQIDGGFTLIPGLLVSGSNPSVEHTWGEFDGVYFVTGFNNSAGTIITEGLFDHLVIQNITRTNAWDFAAIRLD